MADPKPHWKPLVRYGILLLAICLMFYYYQEIYSFFRERWFFFSNKEKIHDYIESFGSYAPLIFIAFQILQVVIAPIPGELTGFIGGYLFGIGPGFGYSTIGLSLGSLLAFSIARWLGLPFVRRFVNQDLMKKFDDLMRHKGAFFSFIFFLIPGIPKDSFCYLLGLSPMNLFTFWMIASVGRIPGTLLLTMQGQAVRSENYRAFFVVLGISLLVMVVLIIYRDRLENWVKQRRSPHRNGKPVRRN